MYQAIVYDRLLEIERPTTECKTEEAARKAGNSKIERLCKACKIEINDDRFYISYIQINQ